MQLFTIPSVTNGLSHVIDLASPLYPFKLQHSICALPTVEQNIFLRYQLCGYKGSLKKNSGIVYELFKMEKGDDSDPMAFLKMMKLKTAEILDQLEGSDGHVLTARRDIDQVDRSIIRTETVESYGDRPPKGLSPDDEVDWWRRKVASLSGPVDSAGSKSSHTASLASDFKSAKEGDEGDLVESKKVGGGGADAKGRK